MGSLQFSHSFWLLPRHNHWRVMKRLQISLTFFVKWLRCKKVDESFHGPHVLYIRNFLTWTLFLYFIFFGSLYPMSMSQLFVQTSKESRCDSRRFDEIKIYHSESIQYIFLFFLPHKIGAELSKVAWLIKQHNQLWLNIWK